MSRFKKLSQSIWHYQYHIVFVPKYRYGVLKGDIAGEMRGAIRAFRSYQKCEVVELNIQPDHVRLLVMIPPKISISDFIHNASKYLATR